MAAVNDPYAYVDADDDYVKVSQGENADFMEFPKENDGTIMFSTIQAQFEETIGLKYKSSSGAWRAIRAVNNVLAPPKGGWGDRVYCIAVTETNKRKRGSSFNDNHVKESKVARPSINHLLDDIAVMGLPFKTTIEELREYFETGYGELAFLEIKYDRSTGKSRGFGFIRFKDEIAAEMALNANHYMEGRKVELRLKKDKPLKLFVGRLPHGVTQEDLQKHFSQFGELKDVYIPTPFRNFAFITFASTENGRNCLQERHVLQGAQLNVMERNPDKKDLNNLGDNKNLSSSFEGYNGEQKQSGAVHQDNATESHLKNVLFQFLSK